MNIAIREVLSKSELKTFVYLPEKIHRNHATWVHPIYFDELAFFNPRRNKSFSRCDTILALAYKGGEPAGRVMGIINRDYNALHNERNARFCFLECCKDILIAEALLAFVSSWAKEKGMQRLVGPLGFSDKDPQGCMIEGYDEEVTLVTNHNFPWMADFYEKLGFCKEVDMVSYLAPIGATPPPYLTAIAGRILGNERYRLVEFSSRRALRPWIVPIFRLVNETYRHIYGFMEMSEREMHEMARRYLPLLNPRFVKVITTARGELIAFLISMPEISNGIRRARGRLFPFGWFHILRASRRSKILTLLLGAVKGRYRGLGIEAVLGMKVFESAHLAGIEKLDSHLILETNAPMIAECERLDSRLHKRFRVFFKEL